VTIASAGIALDGDHLEFLRTIDHPPIVARARDHRTFLDLRSVHPGDDVIISHNLRHLAAQLA
jgi:hypothetical protein